MELPERQSGRSINKARVYRNGKNSKYFWGLHFSDQQKRNSLSHCMNLLKVASSCSQYMYINCPNAEFLDFGISPTAEAVARNWLRHQEL